MEKGGILLVLLTSLILAASFPYVLSQEDGWGPWSDYTECSRTCGGGVQQSSRQCLTGRVGSPRCQGQRIQYQSCNMKECPSGTPDFRTYQCSSYNSVPQLINGVTSTSIWRPYFDPVAPCRLICQNENGDIKTLRDMVVDGTTCDNGNSFGVCISGFCKPVGCDHKIGSVKSEDRCLMCGGTGENCQTIRGTTRDKDLRGGESTEVVTFPVGATKTVIKLTSPSPSALELNSDSGKTLKLTEAMITFGQRKIADFAGTHFNYHVMEDGMEFTARGPINETLRLMLRFQGQRPVVEYEYSIPKSRVLEKDPEKRYSWLYGGWTSCSQECGVGFQLRAISCMDREEGVAVSHDLCTRHEMPDRNQTCNNGPCSNSLYDGYKWVQGHWGECSVNCGVGEQTQLMHCIETGVSGDSVYASDDLCTRYVGEKPVFQRACYGENEGCPYWATGAWDECSVTCGYGMQTRRVYCQRDPANPTEDPVVLKDSLCPESTKAKSNQVCSLQPCRDGSNNDVDVVITKGPKKVDQDCNSSKFGCCRDRVTPAKGDNYYGCKDELTGDPCKLQVDKGGCVNYTVKWYFNDKEDECQRFWYGGCKGNLNRFDDRESCRRQCNKEKLAGVETRRGCSQSRFKCCDDGVTYARGPNKAGCPERRLIGGCGGTRYGCCADGVTAARGQNRMGCPETRVGGCAGTRYGCCADGVTTARGESKLGCPENPSMGCNNTVYGCCADGATAASGPYRHGCPEVKPVLLGGCKSTRYGCCDDGVTAARGSNGEGCPAFDYASCDMSKDPGDCTEYVLKWHLNKDHGMCQAFWYGGCGGNTNRFDSKEECESKCVEVQGEDACRLPKVIGPCRASKKRYYFDAQMGKCLSFTYGGCKGNSNNFHTLGQCQAKCARGGTERANTSACASLPCQNGFTCQDYRNGSYSCSCNPDWGVNCASPPDYWCFSDNECGQGLKCVRKRECNDGYCWIYARCSAALNRYVCDKPVCPLTQDCVNDASFEDGFFCVDKVQYRRPSVVTIGCSRSEYGCCSDMRTPATGPNKQGCRQRCEYSDYGCCRDGVTAADGPDFEGCDIEGSGDVPCERTDYGCCDDGVTAASGPRGKGCGETTDSEERVNNGRPTQGGGTRYGKCMAPLTREFCTEYILKWRFDEQKQGCEQYWSGGCRNNGNEFESQEECEAECVSTVVTDPDNEDPDFVNICDMPQEIGPCRAIIPRYYYDPRDRSCRVFNYGGCQGNENNFKTIEDCQRECMGVVITEEYVTTTAAPTYTLAPPRGTITLSLSGDTTVEEGQELRVACQASGSYQVELEWYINGQPVKSRTDIKLQGRSSVSTGGYGQVGELIIPRAKLEDSGTYYCKSSSGEVERMVISVTPAVRVTRRPTRPTTEAPVDVEGSISLSGNSVVQSGTTLSITCRAVGPRRPTSIDWFFKRQVVSPDSRDPSINSYADRQTRNAFVSELTVVNANKDNEGTYHCRSRPYGNLTQIDIKVEENIVIQPDSSGSDDPADVCRQPKKIGRCRGSFPRFYFDFESGSCESFIFGGCNENKNNFMTKESCERKCAPYIKGRTRNEVEVNDGDTSVCQLDPEKGSCRGYDIKWFYSAARNSCSRFVYTGCEGNGNRFESEEECNSLCVQDDRNEGRRTRRPYRPYSTQAPYVTRAPITRAPITRAPITRAPITRAPQSPCSIPKDAGGCGEWVLKWHYDLEEQKCRMFYYGGCDGNSNRFDSEADCKNTCIATQVTRRPVQVRCYNSEFGCCDDGVTTAVDRLRSNCDDTNVIIQPGTRGDHTVVIVRPRVDAFLQCTQRGQELSWYRDGFLLASSRRMQIYNNGTLALRDVTDDMAGFYACRVSDGNNIPRFQRFKVEVNVPLRILPGPALMSIKPGEDAFMHCQAQGNPQPRVSWDRNGRVLQSNGHFNVFGNGTLIIENVQSGDAGQYECSAENGVAPTVRRAITVKIKETIEADIERHKGIFMEGETIRLNCKGTGYPPPKLEWLKEGKVLKSGGKVSVRGGELSISSAAIEDAGMYKCVTSNDRNQAEDITTVQIKFPTTRVQCEDTMRRTKCHLIVAGKLCGFRMFANKCCGSCRRAGYL